MIAMISKAVNAMSASQHTRVCESVRMHTRVGFHGKDRRPTHLESRIDPMIAMMSKAVTEKMDGPCAMVSK